MAKAYEICEYHGRSISNYFEELLVNLLSGNKVQTHLCVDPEQCPHRMWQSKSWIESNKKWDVTFSVR